jgi:hypothetical protein
MVLPSHERSRVIALSQRVFGSCERVALDEDGGIRVKCLTGRKRRDTRVDRSGLLVSPGRQMVEVYKQPSLFLLSITINPEHYDTSDFIGAFQT